VIFLLIVCHYIKISCWASKFKGLASNFRITFCLFQQFASANSVIN